MVYPKLEFLDQVCKSVQDVNNYKAAGVGGGGGPTTKKTKDILRFSRRHDLFCSFLFFV